MFLLLISVFHQLKHSGSCTFCFSSVKIAHQYRLRYSRLKYCCFWRLLGKCYGELLRTGSKTTCFCGGKNEDTRTREETAGRWRKQTATGDCDKTNVQNYLKSKDTFLLRYKNTKEIIKRLKRSKDGWECGRLRQITCCVVRRVGGNLANVLVVTQSVRSRYLGCHANASRQCLYVAGTVTKCPFTGDVRLRRFDCSVKFYFKLNFFHG